VKDFTLSCVRKQNRNQVEKIVSNALQLKLWHDVFCFKTRSGM